MKPLVTAALALGVATLGLGTALHYSRQNEIRNAVWFKEALIKVAQHKGVNTLIGQPPLSFGDIQRCLPSDYVPKENVEPEPYYVLKVPISGHIGKGTLFLWMNFHCSIEEVRNNINSWNVGLIEVQVGKRVENKFIVR